MPKEFDPISLEIMWNRLTSVVDEAAATLIRTSFSTIVKESNDYACVLLDANGNGLANNTASIPSFIATVPRTVKEFLKIIPQDQWEPGDVGITNDPWLASGHLPDITMAMPIFYKNKLVAFAGTIAHSPDIGGSVWSADTRELYEEGLRIPVMKYHQAGKANATLMHIIRENVRVPEMVFGDINAQITAQTMCRNRLVEFLEDTGLDDLVDLAEEIQSRAESVMRKAIRNIPDGVCEHTVEMDGYESPIILHCKITVSGDELEIDFDGSSAQIGRALNCVMNYTYSYATYPIKCALDPHTPKNEGAYRPITVKAPEGSILNPKIPAPVNARQLVGHMLSACVFGALHKIIPEKVKAESGSQPTLRALFTGSGLDGKKFSSILFANGGMGARFQKDGISCTPFPTNSSCGSIEVLETRMPLLFWKKEMITNSGGPGRFRGGLGQEIIIEVISKDPIRVSLLTDRHQHPAQGYMGGMPGAPNRIFVNDGQYIHPKSQTYLNPGDRLTINYAGGGGYGPPTERELGLIEADLADELITPESGTENYGLNRRS
jgi:N-methylhydantoinase B